MKIIKDFQLNPETSFDQTNAGSLPQISKPAPTLLLSLWPSFNEVKDPSASMVESGEHKSGSESQGDQVGCLEEHTKLLSNELQFQDDTVHPLLRAQNEILISITGYLPLKDFLRFGSVSKPVRSLLIDPVLLDVSLQRFPWVLFPLSQSSSRIGNFQRFPNSKMYHLNLPTPRDGFCGGSPYGSVILFHDESCEVVDPFRRIRHVLPPLETLVEVADKGGHFDYAKLRKVVLPSIEHVEPVPVLIAFVISDDEMAFAKPGDSSWTAVQSPHTKWDDVILSSGVLLAVDRDGAVWNFTVTDAGLVGAE